MHPFERTRSSHRAAAAVLTVLALLASMILVGTPTPAAADLGDQGLVTLDKTVDGVSSATGIGPGESFTYSLLVGCDDNPCIDAALNDTLPAELAGFRIEGLQVSPATPPTATAALVGCSVGGTVTATCQLTVDFEAALGDLGGVPATGIPAGATYRVDLQISVPIDLAPTWPSNGVAVSNTAQVTATNSVPATDSASVTVEVPVEVSVAAAKAWSTDSVQYSPGAEVSFTVTGRNTANLPATSLVLQDPVDAPDGAATLAAGNPFDEVDLVGLCAPSFLPEGTDEVRVDLYLLDAGIWSWQAGPTSPVPTLPDLTGLEVGGLRFTYTSTGGATIVADGSPATQCLTVAQRATNRTTGVSLVGGAIVPNDVVATLEVPGQKPVTDTASDSLTVGALDVVVTPGKTITPGEVAASDSFTVAVAARNDSNGPLTSLTIREPADPGADPFLSDVLVFDGFTSWTWPTGATAAELTWVFADGSTDGPVALTAADPAPTAPGGPSAIVGFEITYTGAIAPGTTAGMGFSVATDPDTVPVGQDLETFTNTVEVSGTNPAGNAAGTATDEVDVYAPVIDLAITKDVRPDLVTPGGTVLLQMTTRTQANRPTVRPTQIVVEDVWDGTAATAFWDAFRARSISFTDVPSGATMDVEYATGTPPSVTWQPLVSGVTGLYSVDFADLVADPDDIVGLRFTFADPAGFAQGTIVRPNVVFEASSLLRDGSPTTVTPGVAVPYDNTSTAEGSGQAGTVPVVSAPVQDTETTSIVDYGGGGPGTVLGSKRWVTSNWSTDLALLPSQSGSAAYTRHGWGVTVPGYTSVRISDPLPGAETTPGSTTFQAFDLTGVRAVSFAEDPLLRWDTVQTVELYVSGAWTTVPAPGGTWMSGTGFKGHTLSASQSAAATGVRVTVVPNDAARAASQEPGRPAPGSGVASGATQRLFGLSWQLRNTVRVPGADGPWATAAVDYNAGEGLIRNDTRVTASTGSVAYDHDASDDIALLDLPPGVGTQKSVSPGSVVVPYPGDVPPGSYPTVAMTVDAWNTASARASYIRVADPVPCPTVNDCITSGSDRDPDIFTGQTYSPTNPFERFSLTGVSFAYPSTVPIDPAATQVALWRYDQGTGTTSVGLTTMAAFDAASAASLADVVGVSIVYQSTDPTVTGGLIPQGNAGGTNRIRMVLQTQLRPTLRSTGADTAGGVEVTNRSLAQSFDPVLDSDATPNASAQAQVQLNAAGLDVTASKSVTPSTVLETDPDVPVTVTLGATDGTSTLAAETASIIDVDPEFWAAFELVGLSTVTRPAGADRVRVDVQVDGQPDWVTGVAAPTASLPAGVTDLATVTGIRFVFLNQPTRPFSATSPSADWSASAAFVTQLRAGATFPGSVVDTAQTEATHVGYPTETAEATDDVVLSTGTPHIDVAKDPVTGTGTKVVEPGVPVPWTLRFTNTGTSFIGVDEVVDSLGPWLRWDGTEPTYSSGGGLPTEGIVVTQPSADRLVFSFPGGSVMAPGEGFEITIDLILQPGLLTSERATNAFTVGTDVTFAPGACTNMSGNGQGVLAGLAPDECGTTNYVQPQGGALLLAQKWVKGEIDGALVDGASNVNDPSLPCVPDADGYFRSVCAAFTAIGATDEWRLDAVNSGTVPYSSLTIVDPLPQPGDRLLATGSARGSQWRPVLDTDFGLVPQTPLPAGAVIVVEVTTSPSPCTGSGAGSTWPSDPTCSASAWVPLSGYAGDPALLTAVRVRIDFTGTTARNLAPGGKVSFAFRTVNVPRVEDLPTPGAVAPALWTGSANQKAWNQTGVTAGLTTGGVISRAPERTGVQLLTGALEVSKSVSGATEFAADDFDFDLACTVPGGPDGPAAVDLGGNNVVTVPADGSTALAGIPLGATCTVTEAGPLGTYGEAGRGPDGPQVVEISAAGGVGTVPADQSVTFDNRYDLGGLTITKAVLSEADPPVDFGPWTFEITCTAPFPEPTVVYDGTFELADDGDSFSLPPDTVPVNATCELTEVDAPEGTTVTGSGVTDLGGGVATIAVGADTEVVVTNPYAVGRLAAAKELVGGGVERYGAGPFTVAAVCTYGAAVVYTGDVVLDEDGGWTATFAEGEGDVLLPAGASCELTETATAGATEAPVFDPGTTVVIEGGEPGGPPPEAPTLVTVTNTFDVGSIEVVKEIDGEGAELYGAGPFAVELGCSYDRDGVPTPITWDGASTLELVLDETNGYSAVVDDLLTGASCEVVAETVTGGATQVVIGDSVVVPGPDAEPLVLTVTNTFLAGDLMVMKERVGDGAALLGGGPFTVQVSCSWVVDGDTVPILVPGGADLVLSAANEYRASVGPLPVGARCQVVETDAGGATEVTYAPSDGTVVIQAPPAGGTVVVTNRFDAPVDVSDDDASSGGGNLPFTGSGRGFVLLVVGGTALLVAGAGIVLSRRRRVL